MRRVVLQQQQQSKSLLLFLKQQQNSTLLPSSGRTIVIPKDTQPRGGTPIDCQVPQGEEGSVPEWYGKQAVKAVKEDDEAGGKMSGKIDWDSLNYKVGDKLDPKSEAELQTKAETLLGDIEAEMAQYDLNRAMATQAFLNKWIFGHTSSSKSKNGGKNGEEEEERGASTTVSQRGSSQELRSRPPGSTDDGTAQKRRIPTSVFVKVVSGNYQPLITRWWVPYISLAILCLTWTPDTWKLRTLYYCDHKYAQVRRMIHKFYWRLTMDSEEYKELVAQMEANLPKEAKTLGKKNKSTSKEKGGQQEKATCSAIWMMNNNGAMTTTNGILVDYRDISIQLAKSLEAKTSQELLEAIERLKADVLANGEHLDVELKTQQQHGSSFRSTTGVKVGGMQRRTRGVSFKDESPTKSTPSPPPPQDDSLRSSSGSSAFRKQQQCGDGQLSLSGSSVFLAESSSVVVGASSSQFLGLESGAATSSSSLGVPASSNSQRRASAFKLAIQAQQHSSEFTTVHTPIFHTGGKGSMGASFSAGRRSSDLVVSSIVSPKMKDVTPTSVSSSGASPPLIERKLSSFRAFASPSVGSSPRPEPVHQTPSLGASAGGDCGGDDAIPVLVLSSRNDEEAGTVPRGPSRQSRHNSAFGELVRLSTEAYEEGSSDVNSSDDEHEQRGDGQGEAGDVETPGPENSAQDDNKHEDDNDNDDDVLPHLTLMPASSSAVRSPTRGPHRSLKGDEGGRRVVAARGRNSLAEMEDEPSTLMPQNSFMREGTMGARLHSALLSRKNDSRLGTSNVRSVSNHPQGSLNSNVEDQGPVSDTLRSTSGSFRDKAPDILSVDNFKQDTADIEDWACLEESASMLRGSNPDAHSVKREDARSSIPSTVSGLGGQHGVMTTSATRRILTIEDARSLKEQGKVVNELHLITKAQKHEQSSQRRQDRIKFWFAVLSTFVIILNVVLQSGRIGLGKIGYQEELAYAEIVLDFFTFASLVANFFIPYEERGRVVSDFNTIRSWYLYKNPTRAAFDIFSTFPMSVCFAIAGIPSNIFARINVLLRTLKFHQFLFTIEGFLPSSIHPSIWRLLTYVLDILIITTIICTFQLLLVLESDPNDVQAWLQLEVDNDERILLYTKVWRHALVTITDKEMPWPRTNAQFGFALCSCVISLVVIVVLIASVEEIVVDIVERSSVVENKVSEVRDMLEHQGLPVEFQEEISWYYRRMYGVTQSFDFRASDELLADLPLELRLDIEYECNAQVIRSIPIFKIVANDEDFVRRLAGELHHCVVMPGAPIVTKGEDGDCMFFVSSGDAAVLGGENDDEIIEVLGAGSFFGETTMLFGGLRERNVVAVTLCICYVITDTQFEGLIDSYPEALEEILLAAMEKLQALQDQDAAAAAMVNVEGAGVVTSLSTSAASGGSGPGLRDVHLLGASLSVSNSRPDDDEEEMTKIGRVTTKASDDKSPSARNPFSVDTPDAKHNKSPQQQQQQQLTESTGTVEGTGVSRKVMIQSPPASSPRGSEHQQHSSLEQLRDRFRRRQSQFGTASTSGFGSGVVGAVAAAGGGASASFTPMSSGMGATIATTTANGERHPQRRKSRFFGMS